MARDVFKKQYVFSSCRLALPTMQEHSVGKAYLYTHPALRVQTLTAKSGKQVTILGNAFCTDAAPKTIQDDVAVWDGKSLLALTQYWTGRWVLLTENELITDAGGLMAAFYKAEQNRFTVSSSLAVMATLLEVTSMNVCSQRGLNWHLLPASGIDGVSKLCCTQRLIFENGTAMPAPYLWPENFTELSTEEKSRQMAHMLINACRNMAIDKNQPLMLALTGGKDSRLVLAALIRSGISFETYTFAYPNISSADKSLPQKMSRAAGVMHRYIKRGTFHANKQEGYLQFSFGDSNGLDAVFYAHDQFDQIPKNTMVIRSGLFEAGQTYGRTVAAGSPEGFEDGMRQYYADALADKAQSTAFDAWLRLTRDNPIPFIDIRDRFYIEQRVGGWAAAIEQSLDINDFTSIQIANCPKLLSLLLSATAEERKEAKVSMESIKQLHPELLRYPVNKKTVVDTLHFIFDVLKSPKKRLRNFINSHLRKQL